MRRLLILMVACGGARPSPAQQEAACNRVPAETHAIVWRDYKPPVGCAPDDGARETTAITDDAAFRAAFPCAAEQPSGVDFATERLEPFELSDAYGGTPGIAWIAVRGTEAIVREVQPAACGGARPGSRRVWIVVPKDLPRPYGDVCVYGSCPPGPPRA